MMSPRFLLAFVMLLFWASATGPVISAESSPAESAAAADKLLSAYHALKAGDVAGARLGFLDVRRMAPGTEQAAEATLRLGYLSEKDKRREEAIGFWVAVTRECVEAPQVAEAAYRLGHTALAADDAKLAEEWFIRGASQKSAPVQMGQLCRANAGFACVSQYWRSRDNRALGRGIEHFRAVDTKVVDPDTAALARVGLGEAYLIRGWGKESLAAYQEALDCKPTSSYLAGLATFGCAGARYVCKDYQQAALGFEGFIASVPGQSMKEKATNWKGATPAFVRLMKTDSAKADLANGTDLVSRAVYWRAKCLYELGDGSFAKEIAESVLKDFPTTRIARKAEDLAGLIGTSTKRSGE